MNLLIVDDELWSRRLIKNVLPWRDLGFKEIFEAGGGEEAIEVINNHKCTLMITDMRMPGVDGAKLLEYINDHNIDIEVIVMSGYEDYKYLHSALKTKAIDYLLKPVVKEELHNAVKRGLHKITKNKSDDYIEEILKRDDLKSEINTYYELKTMLLKSIHAVNQKSALEYLDKIINVYFKEANVPVLTNFVHADINLMLKELEEEHSLRSVNTTLLSPNEIIDRALLIINEIVDSKQSKKVTALDIQSYIHNHFTENITLASIADAHFVSKEHLARIFKKEVGMSIQNYITSKKMEYAKQLLRNHDVIPISTVAHMAGYTDIHYFYRVFKKINGQTPLEYQNSSTK